MTSLEMHVPPCAVGVRPKTGSAVLVAVAGPERPVALLRETVVFATGDHAPERFVYHHAAELDLAAAEAFVEGLRRAYADAAAERLGRVAEALRTQGYTVGAAALACRSPDPQPPLAEIVRSHALIHAAEGAFWAEIWRSAAERLGLRTRHTPEAQAVVVLSERCGVEEDKIGGALGAMGRTLGPPWAAEQRAAAAAAWAALIRAPS